jgi:hypothetical protein
MASLSHGNVVSVLDFGHAGDDLYLALEYVEGVDLAKALRACPRLDEGVAIHVAVCVLRALEYVHTRCTPIGEPLHIVHRDVSPHNILLGTNGDVKLGDFGIAKAKASSPNTSPGTVRGKLAYMSPEHASGLALDGRSDLFSVGVVLYEALLGRGPFDGASDIELFRAVTEARFLDPLEVDPALDLALAGVIRRALQREPQARYASAEEMAQALLSCPGGRRGGPREVIVLVEQTRASQPGPKRAAADVFGAALGARGPTTATVAERWGAATEQVAAGPPARRWWPFVAAALLALAGGGWYAAGPRVGAAPSSERAAAPAGVSPAPSAPAPAAASDPPPPPPAPAPAEPSGVPVTRVAKPRPASPRPAKAAREVELEAARLEINATPWGKVYVDGQAVGDTPIAEPSALSVAPGRHRVRVVNPTGASAARDVELAPGQKLKLGFELRSAP